MRMLNIEEVLAHIEAESDKKNVQALIQKYETENGSKLEYLASGGSSNVFEIGDQIFKFGMRPNCAGFPHLLESLGSATYNQYEILRVFPKMEIGNITEKELQQVYNSLRQAGFVWLDPKCDNLGKMPSTGELKIIDDVDIYPEKNLDKAPLEAVSEYSTSNSFYEIEYLRQADPQFQVENMGQSFRNFDGDARVQKTVSAILENYHKRKEVRILQEELELSDDEAAAYRYYQDIQTLSEQMKGELLQNWNEELPLGAVRKIAAYRENPAAELADEIKQTVQDNRSKQHPPKQKVSRQEMLENYENVTALERAEGLADIRILQVRENEKERDER